MTASNQNKINAYKFNNEIIRSNLSTNKYKIRTNKFLSFISSIYNNQNKNPNASEFTSNIFYSICPKSPESQRSDYRKLINPDNTLEGVFDRLGGKLCVYKGYGHYNYKEEPVIGFTWFHSNFENIINLGTTIELDATFTVLKPSIFCIPQMIFRNTGFPLGLIVGPTESSDFYSLFFHSLKKFDANGSLFKYFTENKNYLTDQHKSFNKLKKMFNLKLFHCFVHIIRSCGSKSALSLIIKEMLFCISKETFEKKKPKWKALFNQLVNDPNSSAKQHKDIFERILQLDQQYAPLFVRMNESVPTTTNHSESFHRFLNNSVPHKNVKLMTRVAMIAEKINERLMSLNKSIIRNFKNYIKSLREQAQEHLTLHPGDNKLFNLERCDCPNCIYFSMLYGGDVPCIHQILNARWSPPKVWKSWFEGKEIFLSNIQTELKTYEIDQVLAFEEEGIEDNNDTASIPGKIDIVDSNKYEDELAQLIYECHYQLRTVMQIDKEEVGAIAMRVQEEMFDNQILKAIKEKSPDTYYAILQKKIWKLAYIEKDMLNKF